MNGLLGAGIAASAGLLAGLLYFRAVWASAQQLAAGGGAGRAILSGILRFGLAALLLAAAARQGALPLLAAAAGFLAGRAIVMRRNRTP